MTRDEAAQLLNVTPNARGREVDNAFTSLRLHYVSQQQFSTQPRERDAATLALGLIHEAYATLTGLSAASAKLMPKSESNIASDEIPRVSLGGQRVTPKRSSTRKVSSPAGRSRWEWQLQFQWPVLETLWRSNRETAVALAICAGVILIAILMLALSR